MNTLQRPRSLRHLTSGLAAAAILLLPTHAPGALVVGDDTILEALENNYFIDDTVSLNDIDVAVDDGLVKLTGRVDNLLASERAVRIAESIRGVRAIVNLIEVSPHADIPPEQLLGDIKAALINDPTTESYEIDVRGGAGGEITLTGEVDSWPEAELALRIAKGVRGVVSVNDELEVVPSSSGERSDSEIELDIESRLRWDTLVDDVMINVEVKGGRVTLDGTVGSLAEKRRARYGSWVLGVGAVNDEALEVKTRSGNDYKRRGGLPTRGDEQIRDALVEALRLHPRVKEFRVDVDVNRSRVTLRGEVTSLAAKQAAETVARDTIGVFEVANRLKVRLTTPRSDKKIRSVITRMFELNPLVPAEDLTVRVDDGVVGLRGEVETVTQRLEAEAVAGRSRGIKRVDSFLTVADGAARSLDNYDPYLWEYHFHPWARFPHVSPPGSDHDSAIREKIQRKLLWSPFLDASAITVEVKDRTATLKGEIGSERQRSAAIENAIEGGAKDVIDRLRIVR